MKHKRCNTGVDIVVEVQSKVEVFPDHQWTDVTCVIGHGDGDLCKLTSLGCILSSSTSLIKFSNKRLLYYSKNSGFVP